MLSLFFSPKGRIRRRDYAFGVAVILALLFLAAGVDIYGVDAGQSERRMMVLGSVGLLCLWPWLALGIKRWHDTGRTGFWMLVCFLPIVALFAYLALLLIPGNRDSNRFGANPRGRATSAQPMDMPQTQSGL